MTITELSAQYRLPEEFIRQLLPLLKEEADAFFASYTKPYERGVRFRDERISLPPGDLDGKIPYSPNCYYLNQESKAGALPLHDAGAYYIQEPSAMAAAAVLHPAAGDRILDLCAAPGGKSTQLASMAPLELLICNEPIPSRAQVLSGNIERMGISNALVTCAYPEQLAKKWPGFFDKILVDAPCSGEGMFRRHPETVPEWTPDGPQRCHRRQVQILSEAAKMLRKGGRMVFSTCTFNDTENENTVSVFLQEHPNFRLVPIDVPGLPESQSGMLRLWPHRFRGEGHFVALLEKQDALPNEASIASVSALAMPDKTSLLPFSDFKNDLGLGIQPNVQQHGKLFQVPSSIPPLVGIRVLRFGLHIGEIKGKIFIPDHALAMAIPMCKVFKINDQQASFYLHGDTLPCADTLRGYYVISYNGYQMGFAKASGGQMKNHYPKGLRK